MVSDERKAYMKEYMKRRRAAQKAGNLPATHTTHPQKDESADKKVNSINNVNRVNSPDEDDRTPAEVFASGNKRLDDFFTDKPIKISQGEVLIKLTSAELAKVPKWLLERVIKREALFT